MTQGPLIILHADDDEGDRFLFGEALSKVPVDTRLVSVAGGEQLLNYLSAEVELPHIVFLDLNMPKVSGFDCLNRIKLIPALQSLPVVICSTSGDENSVQQTFDAGALLYMIKPFNFENFVMVIHQVIDLLGDEKFTKPTFSAFVINKNGSA